MTVDEQLKDLRGRYAAIRLVESEMLKEKGEIDAIVRELPQVQDFNKRMAKLTFDKGEFDRDVQALVKDLAPVGAGNEVNLVELICRARGIV
jgi:hypothetical protein